MKTNKLVKSFGDQILVSETLPATLRGIADEMIETLGKREAAKQVRAELKTPRFINALVGEGKRYKNERSWEVRVSFILCNYGLQVKSSEGSGKKIAPRLRSEGSKIAAKLLANFEKADAVSILRVALEEAKAAE
jgi:hypothetical protein